MCYKNRQTKTLILTSRGRFSQLSLNHTWESAQRSVTAELTYEHSCCKVSDVQKHLLEKQEHKSLHEFRLPVISSLLR